MNANQHDIAFRRCGCLDPSGHQYGADCPRLADPDHGSWYYAIQVRTVGGHHTRYRHGGYPTRQAAIDARNASLAEPAAQVAAESWTMARWLRTWIDSLDGQLRPTTIRGYRDHVTRILIPALGKLPLAELSTATLQECFVHIAHHRNADGNRLAPSTVDHIRATLRSALNAAVRAGLLATNPIYGVQIRKPTRPYPVVWTDEVVDLWKRTSVRPPVAVWTLAQLIRFLDGVREDRLAALWWLVALRGLRRGEVAGLQRDDLDAEHQQLHIHTQIVALPGELHVGQPKSRSSTRTVALDLITALSLVQQSVLQDLELVEQRYVPQRRSDARRHTGQPWDDERALFTYADGRPIRPEYLTHRFKEIITKLGLPPIRFHDLRHGAATLALAAHTDLKVIQQLLGHASIVTTADTYTSVLPDVAYQAAASVAELVLAHARRTGIDLNRMTHALAANATAGYYQT